MTASSVAWWPGTMGTLTSGTPDPSDHFRSVQSGRSYDVGVGPKLGGLHSFSAHIQIHSTPVY